MAETSPFTPHFEKLSGRRGTGEAGGLSMLDAALGRHRARPLPPLPAPKPRDAPIRSSRTAGSSPPKRTPDAHGEVRPRDVGDVGLIDPGAHSPERSTSVEPYEPLEPGEHAKRPFRG